MKTVALILLVCLTSAVDGITLDAALARTLEKNPVIQQAKARLEEAAGRRMILRSSALPSAGFGIPIGVQGGKRAGENSVQPFAFAQGGFVQPLFHADIPASYRRGNIEVLIAQQRLNVAVLEQLHLARVAFYTAAYNTSLHSVGEAQRARLEENFQAQSDRYAAGKADRPAVMTARLLEQELKPRLEEFQRTYSGATLTLAQAMGENLGANAKLPTADGDIQFAQVDLNVERESNEALQDRADLKLARLLIRAAAEDQRIIEAAYYPAVDLTVSGTYIPASDIHRGSAGTARPSDDIISSEVRAGGSFTWRVIDNGLTRGAVIRQRAAREINETVLARLEAAVPRDLTRIQNNLRALQARHDAQDKAASVAEQTVADVQNNLAQGLSSQLEYRTAESSFLETKASVLRIAFEQQLALAERDRVTGRYFQFSDDTRGKLH
jgi:outer membrane protein TolC